MSIAGHGQPFRGQRRYPLSTTFRTCRELVVAAKPAVPEGPLYVLAAMSAGVALLQKFVTIRKCFLLSPKT